MRKYTDRTLQAVVFLKIFLIFLSEMHFFFVLFCLVYLKEIGEEKNKAIKITTDKQNEAEAGGKKGRPSVVQAVL